MEPAHNLLFNQVKAGLGYVDPDQISHKITEVSKDTKFYQKQKERSKLIDGQIDDLKVKLRFASKSDLNFAKIQVDSFISSLEKKRNLDQVIFHADLDAFFASVEVINDPSLEGIPFAVGGSIKHGVISTSSYEARKFGVRSGMAVFIALSLCPQLRIVKHSGRYAEFSELVQSEFAYYDPNYISFGLDEASMNVTEYLQKTQQTPIEVAKEIQEKVFNKTKLTISIGIGPTNQLAKIASDINKPNGVYEIPRDVDGMMEFIRSLSVRKIPGVGGVTERKLQELNFLKMSDILDRREEVWFLFSNSFCKFIFSSALGIQYSTVSHDERKSISNEETFEATDDLFELMDRVERMAEKLALKLQRDSMRCKTVTVKFKTHDFQTITHAFSFKQDTSKTSDITGAAIKILMEEHQKYRRKLRLIGVRVSNLLYPGQKIQKSISDWISNEKNSSSVSSFEPNSMTEVNDWEQEEVESNEIDKSQDFDHSIKRCFKEGYNESDAISEEFPNQAEIGDDEDSKSSEFDYSIKRYFKKGYNESDVINSEFPNQAQNDEEDEGRRSIDSNYSIKRYFKQGYSEISQSCNYQSDNLQNSETVENEEENEVHSGYSIKRYFKKGYIESDSKSQIDKKDNYKKKQPNDFSIKSYFNKKVEIKSSINERCQKTENEFSETDDENEQKGRLDYHFQSGNLFDKSSDYDDDDLVAKNDRYLSTINFCPRQPSKTENIAGKKKVNIMKNIIEKYYPETMWESEIKNIKHSSRSIHQESAVRKSKTKVGTFQIRSFFSSASPTTE